MVELPETLLKQIRNLPRGKPSPHMFDSPPDDAERRLADALAIVDAVAAEAGLPQDPCFALALLNEDEQVRLYALLKGEG